MAAIVLANSDSRLACISAATVTTKISATDASTNDAFGKPLELNSEFAVVGVPRQYSDDRGAAYIFDSATAQQLKKLSGSSPGSYFGISVSLSGDNLVVGAPGEINQRGSAYVFNVRTGQQIRKIAASDGTSGDFFGTAAIDGNHILIGAPGKDGPFATDSGAVYLFDATTGEQRLRFTASDSVRSSNFGRSIALSGNLAVIGADGISSGRRGAAYLFDITTGLEIAKLVSPAFGNQNFGNSMDIEGNLVLVGSSHDDRLHAGAAYLFDATTGQQLHKFTASDGGKDDQFGVSVAMSGNLAIIGANGDNSAAGSAYLFDLSSRQQLAKLTAFDPALLNQFGFAVAIHENRVLIGSPYSSGTGKYSGSAYLYAYDGIPEIPPVLPPNPNPDVPEPTTLLLVITSALQVALVRWRH